MYDHLFFDADGTLFDFISAERWALSLVFTELGIPADDESLKTYSNINNGVWLEFEQGLISMNDLKTERFNRFFAHYQVSGDPVLFSRRYTEMLSHSFHLYPDALEVLRELRRRSIPLSLITNGISSVQRGRLEATGTAEYFNTVIISEEIGVQKPHRDYFTKALELVEKTGPPARNPLIIGDSPTSDIQGGVNAGMDTCWINRFGMERDSRITPTHEVRDLHELLALLDELNQFDLEDQ